MRWKVMLYGIVWDDGKGEYDVGMLPTNLEVRVNADDSEEAIGHALAEATDSYDTLIDSTEQIVASRL